MFSGGFALNFATKSNNDMGKIKLSKNARRVLKAAACGVVSCPACMTVYDFNNGARELAIKGLLHYHEEECGNVEAMKLSEAGIIYISTHKRLMNPVNCSMIAAIAACVAAVAAVAALFVACTRL